MRNATPSGSDQGQISLMSCCCWVAVSAWVTVTVTVYSAWTGQRRRFGLQVILGDHWRAGRGLAVTVTWGHWPLAPVPLLWPLALSSFLYAEFSRMAEWWLNCFFWLWENSSYFVCFCSLEYLLNITLWFSTPHDTPKPTRLLSALCYYN